MCDGAALVPHFPGLLRCGACGHVAADMELSAEELSRLYGHDYFHGKEYADYLAEAPALCANFRARLRVLLRHLPPDRRGSLLEIGSAYGLFLDLARREFREVRGIDISEEGVRHAREQLGIDVRQGDFLGLDLQGRQYDAVCLWDTLEHLAAPQLHVARAASLMDRGALLAITTGDIGSLVARFKGPRWRLIHPPTHLHYFSAKSLGRLLDRHGFDLVHLRHVGFSRSIDQIAYFVLVLRQQRAWAYRAIRSLGIGRLRLYLNLYDIMYVVARRR